MTFMRRLTLQIEGDLIDIRLREMYAESKKPLSPINRMIDSATGADRAKLKEARKLINRMEKIKKMLEEA